MRIRRNVSTAGERTMFLVVYDADGALCDPLAISVADLLYDPGTGVMVAATGTLTNRTKPLVVADFTFTTTHATETVNATAHGLSTGDGPFRATTTTTLPAGYALATDYWWITVDADHGKLAASLAAAIAGTPVAITSDGTGTHTLSDTASTRRLMPGQFLYTFTQAETNVTAPYVSITVAADAIQTAEQTADIYLREMDELLVGSHTRADIERLMLAVEAGPATGFVVGTIVFKCPITGTVRLTGGVIPDGRSAPTFIIGTLT